MLYKYIADVLMFLRSSFSFSLFLHLQRTLSISYRIVLSLTFFCIFRIEFLLHRCLLSYLNKQVRMLTEQTGILTDGQTPDSCVTLFATRDQLNNKTMTTWVRRWPGES